MGLALGSTLSRERVGGAGCEGKDGFRGKKEGGKGGMEVEEGKKEREGEFGRGGRGSALGEDLFVDGDRVRTEEEEGGGILDYSFGSRYGISYAETLQHGRYLDVVNPTFRFAAVPFVPGLLR